MSETILRQLAMLRRVPRAPRAVTTAVLVEKLGEEGFTVSIRSVQRDLEMLSALFPLGCDDRVKPYGWSWEKHALQELPGMDTATALTFTLAARFLGPLMPRSSLRYLEPHFQRAEAILTEMRSGGFAAWPAKVRAFPRGQPLLPAEVDPEVLDVVDEALLTGRRFLCAYHRKGETERQEYEVNPLGLVVREAVSYLIATLWDYGDIRQLALHRMAEPKLLERPASPIPGLNLDAYIAEGAFGYRESEGTIRLKVRFSDGAAQHLYETPLAADQALTEESGSGTTLLQATVLDTAELRWWLLGFGDQVEVLDPRELREEFRAVAKVLCSRYGEG